MALLIGVRYLNPVRPVTAPSQSTLNNQWIRTYAKDAKSKGKSKASSDKPVVKKLRISRTELRKRSVILTETVPGVGEVGEELKVARGFARNFLFAKNVAKLATPELRIHYAPQLAMIDFDARAKAASLNSQKKKISSVTVQMKRHFVVETNKPIAPITKENIIEKLQKQWKIELQPEQLDLFAPLDRYGKFELPVRLEGMTTLLHVNVTQR